ncbi:MAG: hypothetical protein ACRDGQ_09690 [Candidatus Limnocylindrales bacterium]
MIRERIVALSLESAFALASSGASLAALYLWVHPLERAALGRRFAEAIRRAAGIDRRAYLASPAAEFARRRRDELIAAEMAS